MTDSHALATIQLQQGMQVLRDWQAQVDKDMDNHAEEILRHQRLIDDQRRDLDKTNRACLLENQAWSRINDLVGLQAEQIRTLGRQLAQLDRTLSAHLEDAGYSE